MGFKPVIIVSTVLFSGMMFFGMSRSSWAIQSMNDAELAQVSARQAPVFAIGDFLDGQASILGFDVVLDWVNPALDSGPSRDVDKPVPGSGDQTFFLSLTNDYGFNFAWKGNGGYADFVVGLNDYTATSNFDWTPEALLWEWRVGELPAFIYTVTPPETLPAPLQP